MNKYERLLYILNLIRTRKNLNARELARACEVTERTIFRDITALSSAKIPIYYDRGYKLLTENFLPTLNFSFREFLTAREALRSTPLRKLPEYNRTLKALEAKMEARLAPQVREQVKSVGKESFLEVKERPASARQALWFELLERATQERRVIQMTYDSIDTGIREREVEPCFTIYVDGKFYFVGYCLWRNSYRTFRLSRIQKLTVVQRHFKRHRYIDPKTHFANSWSVFGGEVLDVTLEFSGRSARLVKAGSYLAGEKKVSRPDGKLLYRGRVAGIAEIGRWLLGFGSEVKIIAPDELRLWAHEQASGFIAANS